MTNSTHFDSVFMNMTQAFQELLSIAAKADTDDALIMLLETIEDMTQQLDSAYDSHVDKSECSIQSESTIQAEQIDLFTVSVIDSSSPYMTQIRNNVAKLNTIVKAVATGEANSKSHGKEQLLNFIFDCYEGFEQILAFMKDVEEVEGETFPSQVTEYIKSRQSILITCYDNVAISE